MDLRFSPQEEDFRAQVRDFLSRKLPAELSDKVRRGARLAREDMALWHRILHERGWLATHWPVEYGGTGWDVVQRFIFDTECALAHAPRIVPFGLSMLGPVLMQFGTQAQKDRWLPRILDGSDWWCQGFSEPGAGSDLAGLKAQAVRDGASYVVNGQKTWTTFGHYANRMFCLVRTDREAKKQEGISFLLIDMASPGIEVRPILTLEGEHEVNEVFFTDVRVPAENLVGQENRGWTCAKYLLTYERTNIAGVGHSTAALDLLREAARQRARHGRRLLDDPLFAARLARVQIDLENMKTTNLRMLAEAAKGAPAGPASSMLKIRGTEILQEITALLRRAAGAHGRALGTGDAPVMGPPGTAGAAAHYFNYRKLSIFGGSNEIQKNILTKTVLDL
jgi:hypothetical protein